MDRYFVYIYSPIFNYLWGLFYCPQGTDAWMSRLDHCATRTAQRLSRALLNCTSTCLWRTCLAGAADRADITPPPPIQSMFVPLDISHM